MSPQLVAGLIVLVSVGAWFVFLGYTALMAGRRKTEEVSIPLPEHEEALAGAKAVEGAPGYVRELPGAEPRPKPRRVSEDVEGVTRRQFLNRASIAGSLIALGQFGMASLDFLFPRLRGGFGAKITVDLAGVSDVDEIRARLTDSRTPEFVADGRFYLAVYEGDPADAAKIPTYKAANVPATGIMALYRKCVHLGCSVPWCASAKWFECPCHGSKYSINGEYRDGPAPRSLDMFRVEIKGGKIIVDTSSIILGAPRGTITAQPQPEGIHCIDL
ncbi:MAG TPA: Rieske 2Fe-2S domain-containing protein [Actinomycetota bacterium]|nr:Rieske 2Fe-2S domain-containing protein [Actinomycetota bacterium]